MFIGCFWCRFIHQPINKCIVLPTRDTQTAKGRFAEMTDCLRRPSLAECCVTNKKSVVSNSNLHVSVAISIPEEDVSGLSRHSFFFFSPCSCKDWTSAKCENWSPARWTWYRLWHYIALIEVNIFNVCVMCHLGGVGGVVAFLVLRSCRGPRSPSAPANYIFPQQIFSNSI